MLDKNSEKFLELAVSKFDGDMEKGIKIKCNEMSISYSEINALCSNLLKCGYVQSFFPAYSEAEPVEAYLTHTGLHYFENKNDETIRFWLPIVVSNVISVLALIISILAYLEQ